MKSLRRMFLERLMRKMKTLHDDELVNLLRMWANQPQLLWGKPMNLSDVIRHTHKDGSGQEFVYEYDRAPDGRPKQGVLKMPHGQVASIRIERFASADNPRLLGVTVAVDVQAKTTSPELRVTASWTHESGLLLTVKGRPGLIKVLRSHYGRRVASATTGELVRMYLTHVFPGVVVERSRIIGLGPA